MHAQPIRPNLPLSLASPCNLGVRAARLWRPSLPLICWALICAMGLTLEASAEPRRGIAMYGEPALAAGFTALPYVNPDAPKGGRMTIGLQGTFDSLNPYNVKAGSAVQGLTGTVVQSLMARSMDEPFTLYGLIADTIDTDEARSYVTFHINPAARFSDERPITAQDVKFTFELLRQKGRPQHRSAFSQVKGVTIPDERSITFDLQGVGDRELPLILGLMPVFSSQNVDVSRFEEANLEALLGSGPYRVSEIKPGESLVLKRNPNYWGKDHPMQKGLYNFDEIKIEYFRDANSLFEAFKSGLIDYREETNSTRWLTGYDIPPIHDGRLQRESLPLGGPKGMLGFAFNMRRPLFQDERIREALGLMFDFEWINANLFGGLYRRTPSFFAESELSSQGRPASQEERQLLQAARASLRADIMDGSYAPPVSDGSGRDRALAQKAVTLFHAAGYEIRNGDMVQQSNGQKFEFEILVADRNQERLALNFSDSLRRIGVQARVRVVDEVQYQRRRQKFDFDMMMSAWLASASPGNEQRSRWGSASANQDSSFNLAGVQSLAIDHLIDAIVSAKDRDEFVTSVRAYDRLLRSGFYIIPLYHAAEQWIAYNARLQHSASLPHYANPLFSLTLDSWWMKTP